LGRSMVTIPECNAGCTLRVTLAMTHLFPASAYSLAEP
jgi:hypothetical protein